MEAFSALLDLCAGKSLVTGLFPAQRPETRSFDVFFHLYLNKRLSKQSRGWWFETPLRSLWRHCNDYLQCADVIESRHDVLRISEAGIIRYRLYQELKGFKSD